MLGHRHDIPYSHGWRSSHAAPSRQEQYATSGGGNRASRFCAVVHSNRLNPYYPCVENRSNLGTVFCRETEVARRSSATNCAPVPPVEARLPQARRPVIGNRQVQFVALCNGVRVSCVQYRGRRARRLSKHSVQMDGLPTKWSETLFPKSLQRFGRPIQRLTSRLCVAAACARQNAISAVSANGLAMPLPRSSARFLSAMECETSA